MGKFLDASGLNQYTLALKNGTLIVGRAKDSSKADYAKDASTAFYASNVPAAGIIGVIDISHIPHSAIEKLVHVADEAARFALTTATVQLGDTVQQDDTHVMYIVVDEDHLDSEAGYQEYSAGIAAKALSADSARHADGATDASTADYATEAGLAAVATEAVDASTAHEVPWTGIQDKPTEFKPEAHTHGAVDVSTLTGYSEAESVDNVNETDTLLVALGKIEKKADEAAKSAGFHTQDGSTIVGLQGYSIEGVTYSAVDASDNLVDALEKIERKALDASNTADWDSITNKPTTYDASIVMMTGYSKAGSVADVAESDSARTAIGKVEAKVDDVSTNLSTGLSAANTKIDDVSTALANQKHPTSDITSLGGYTKGSEGGALSTTDTLNQALSKIENRLDVASDVDRIPGSTIDKIIDGKYDPAHDA